jgi:hypothetical protein
MPRHGKEGTTMPRKVTAIADLTAIGYQVETTATAAEKMRWLGRDLVIWPDAIGLIMRAGLPRRLAQASAVLWPLLVAVGAAADAKHLKLNRKRVPDSRVLADVGQGQ